MSPEAFSSVTEGVSEGVPPRAAEGGTWLETGELAMQLRAAPGRQPAGPWLLPSALLVLGSVWVSSYFGAPSALMHVVVLAFLIGHFWPTWLAADCARHWAPKERYLRFRVGPEGIATSSAERDTVAPWSSIVSTHRAAAGWLVRFADTPPLWLPRSAFSEEDVELVGAYLAPMPVEPRGRLQALCALLLVAVGWLGTIAWYLSAR
jgi:hypothetical protein